MENHPIIPEPPASLIPFLGHLTYFTRNRFNNLLKLAKEYGPIFKLRLGSENVVVVTNLDLVKEVCDDKNFDKKLSHQMLLAREELTGDALISSKTDEPSWSEAHRILQPEFQEEVFQKEYMPMMLDIFDQLVSSWDAAAAQHKEIEMTKDMSRVTFDTIALCGCHYRFNSFSRDELHPFLVAMTEALNDIAYSSILPKTVQKLRFIKNRKRQNNIALLYNIVDSVIKERELHPEKHANQRDFLGAMLDQKASAQSIRHQLLSLLIAGFEPMAALLSFAMYAICANPDVQKKVYEEVDSVLGRDISQPPLLENVLKLKYIQQVLLECLRLWPPQILITRQPREDYVLGGQYPIKKGQSVWPLFAATQRDKAIWGLNADEFNPNHFSPENVTKRDPSAYFPFGVGQRECMGREFALFAASLLIGMVMQRYRLHLRPDYEFGYQNTLMLTPNPLWVTIEKRADMASAGIQESSEEAEKGLRIAVIFGSNMGTSEGIARRIAKDAQAQGCQVKVMELDEWAKEFPSKGPQAKMVIAVTATYNGTPPDNAVYCEQWMLHPDGSRGNFKFIVFGCGNTDWKTTYQDFPKFIQQGLFDLGGEEIYPRGEADANVSTEDAFEKWYEGFWSAVFKTFGMEQTLSAEELAQESVVDLKFDILPSKNPPITKVSGMEIRVNRELLQDSTERSTRHIELAVPPGAKYSAGDYIAVYGENHPEMVKKVLERFGLDVNSAIKIHPDQQTFLPLDREIPILDLLTRYVDLHDVATRRHIKQLADHLSNPIEKEKMLNLMEAEAFQDLVLNKQLSTLDLLTLFPACTLSFDGYLSLLPAIRPRYYSISSSPTRSPETCSITVGVVKLYPSPTDTVIKGFCSNYLASKGMQDTIKANFTNENPSFKLPDDKSIPLLLICAGTGFSPFRGFLQERQQNKLQGSNIGKATLFFGIRHPDKDYLYKEELQEMANQGVVDIFLAPSRVEGQPKCYVQDLLWQEKERVWGLISQAAIIYVCGEGSKMAPAVKKTLERIYMHYKNCSSEQAQKWMIELEKQKLYRVDAWSYAPTIGSAA